MPEEETRADAEDAVEEASAETAADAPTDAQAETEAAEQAEDAAAEPEKETPARTSDWPDLEGYREQLRADHVEWSERVSAVGAQLAALAPALVALAAQQRALGILDDLERLNEAVLGGAAVTQTLRLGYGLERYLVLFWPAALDPRPTLAQAAGDGEYRVEVYLHVGPDGQPRIRVEGARRLEAPLPTSRARVRGVLLSAIQNPKLVVAGGGAEDETGAVPPTERAQPAADGPPPDDRPSAARPGDADQAPPPEEQVIPLGPSEAEQRAANEETSNQSG